MGGLVVDTSALVAIINGESEAPEFLRILISADRVCLSVASAHELNCVMQRYRREDGPRLLDGLLARLDPELIPFDSAQLAIARIAYERYGRGSKHPAALNMADCYSFALAKLLDMPLLYKGNDFTQTDIAAAYSI